MVQCSVLQCNCTVTSSSSSSSFGCSHSGVATVFKHPHRRFGSVLRRMPFLTQPTDSRGSLARPFNVLGCTLEGNQLRYCAAKPIVQAGFYTRRASIQDQPSASRTHYPLSYWGSVRL